LPWWIGIIKAVISNDISVMIRKLYGQLQADADAGTQPPVQMGSPELLKVIDPSCIAEQNAWPDTLILHLPGPQSALPSRGITIPPYGGEQAIMPSVLIKHVPPGGGQTIFPSRSLTQGFFSSFDQAVTFNKSIMIKLITAIRVTLLM
jgi:hypothetical protein